MRSDAVRRAFARRVRALGVALPATLDDDVEALHRSRVASRRLREILPVLALEEATPIRSRVRRLTRALGGVRELDVALGILEELGARCREAEPAVTLVRAAVAEERRRLAAEMKAELTDFGALNLPDALRAIEPVVHAQPRQARRATLARRLARRAGRLQEAIDRAGALYASERLHQVRIAAKQLRYVLELVHEFGGVGTRRLTARVKQFQELLGRLHDLEVVSDHVRRQARQLVDIANGPAVRLQAAIDLELRELHAEYLAGVARLRDVVVKCRTLEPRLAATATRRVGGSR